MTAKLIKSSKEKYETLIFEFRGIKVMVDADLALLYDVPTKRLKEQVKRNSSRFPDDFMFSLNRQERVELIAQAPRLATLRHTKVLPMVFTELGIAMLSSVLGSEQAILINIEIMRTFAHYRSMLRENEELKKQIAQVDNKVDKGFEYLLERIDELHYKKLEIEPIGYKLSEKNP